MTDRENDRWRVILVRLLLCLTIILYLGSSVLVQVVMPGMHATRSLLFAGVLCLLCAFGALGLSRLRTAAVAATGVAAFLSILLLVGVLVVGRLPSIALDGSLNWERAIGQSLAIMLYEMPVLAFLLAWPLRRAGDEISEC